MLPQKRLEQIQEMETLLGQSEAFLLEAEQFLEKWQQILPTITKLEHYYFDGDWRQDYQAYEQGEIPEEMPCGVLTEDAIFDASVTQRSLAIGYLKLVAQILDTPK